MTCVTLKCLNELWYDAERNSTWQVFLFQMTNWDEVYNRLRWLVTEFDLKSTLKKIVFSKCRRLSETINEELLWKFQLCDP